MKVMVLGLPGMKTQQTLINLNAAIKAIDPTVDVEWIWDAAEMLDFKITKTPTVMIDNRANFGGRVPSIHELTTWIHEEFFSEVEA